MFLLKPNLTDENLDSAIGTIRETLEKNQAIIGQVENMGKKTLAYKVKKEKEAFYALMEFKAESSVVSASEKVFKLNDNILRVMITLKDEK